MRVLIVTFLGRVVAETIRRMPVAVPLDDALWLARQIDEPVVFVQGGKILGVSSMEIGRSQ